jgi:hypothetical protein
LFLEITYVFGLSLLNSLGIIIFLFELKINYNNNNISIKNIKKLKSISNDLIKSILYQLVSNYNNNTNINYILLNKLTNIQKKIF